MKKRKSIFTKIILMAMIVVVAVMSMGAYSGSTTLIGDKQFNGSNPEISAIPIELTDESIEIPNTSVLKKGIPLSELWFDFGEADMNQMFYYKDTIVPVNFKITGLLDGQTADVSVDDNVGNATYESEHEETSLQYDNRKNEVKMNIEVNTLVEKFPIETIKKYDEIIIDQQLLVKKIQEPMKDFQANDIEKIKDFQILEKELRTLDDMKYEKAKAMINALEIDEVKITVASDWENSIPATLYMYVINSEYGVFVNYIGKMELAISYHEWLLENGYIDEDDFKYVCKVYDSANIDDIDSKEVMKSSSTYVPSNSVIFEYRINAFSNDRLSVSGNVYWSDNNNNKFPAEEIKIEIYDDNGSYNQLLAYDETSTTGYFYCSFDNNLFENGYDIFVRAYPSNGTIHVDDNSGNIYYVDTYTQDDVTESMLEEVEPKYSSNKTKAFQIHQAALVGERYAEAMSGASKSVTVRFPVTSNGGSSFYTSLYDRISLYTNKYYVWDVILHEYGHFIQDKYNLINSPGGTHGFSQILFEEHGKNDGLKLAFSEGWATYFSLSAQQHQDVASMNILYAGDLAYDFPTSNYGVSAEGDNSIPRGEGDELAVLRVLWDLADDYTSSETFDDIELGFQEIWNLTYEIKANRLDEFIEGAYPTFKSYKYREVSAILSKAGVSGEVIGDDILILEQYNGVRIYPGQEIEGYENAYTLEFYDLSMNLITSKAITSSPTYDVDGYRNINSIYTSISSIWTDLVNENGDFYVTIKMENSKYPSTGPYYSEFVRCRIE